MARKVIQISESMVGSQGGHWNCTALCDDGTMWIIHNVHEQWAQLPNVPQEIEEEKFYNTQQANYEICHRCGGSGRVYMCAEDGDGIKCHRCSGSGKLS